MAHHVEGKLRRIPGLPVMYDYEFYPQKVRLIQANGAHIYECLALR